MSKQLNTRVQYKYDKESAWNSSTLQNTTSLTGELYIYASDVDLESPRIKIGDGENTIKDLPFIAGGHTEDSVRLPKPYVDSVLTYDGYPQLPLFINYNASKMDATGQLYATDAGEYTARFTPAYGYTWEDGSSDSYEVTWSINKSLRNLSLSTNTVVFDDTTSYVRILIDYYKEEGSTYDALYETSNNNFFVTISEDVLTISRWFLNDITTTVTVKLEETKNFLAEYAVVNVSNTLVLPGNGTLDECSWDLISRISAAGLARSCWEIGDWKNINLPLTTNTGVLDGAIAATTHVYIIGFDHNEEWEGKGIHFGTFKTYGTAQDPATELPLVEAVIKRRGSMAGNNWNDCPCRYNILGSTDNFQGDKAPTEEFKSFEHVYGSTIIRDFPSDLVAVMKPMTKYTSDKPSGSSEGSTYKSIDYLPIMSLPEMYGNDVYGSSFGFKEKQYDYYKTGNSGAVKYKFAIQDVNGTATVAVCWTRTLSATSYQRYYTTSPEVYWEDHQWTTGNILYGNSDEAYFSPIFKV